MNVPQDGAQFSGEGVESPIFTTPAPGAMSWHIVPNTMTSSLSDVIMVGSHEVALWFWIKTLWYEANFTIVSTKAATLLHDVPSMMTSIYC